MFSKIKNRPARKGSFLAKIPFIRKYYGRFICYALGIQLCLAAIHATTLVQWNTVGNAGTETSEPSVFNDPAIGASNLLLESGVTSAANADRLGGRDWFDTGDTAAGTTLSESVSGNDYIQFTITPNSGFQITPTSLIFSWDHSSTGPASLTLRSSADNYTANLGSVTGLAASLTTNNTLTISGLSNFTAPTTFRLYGYDATSGAGTGGFDTTTGNSTPNVTLNGDVVPEPASGALLLVGVGSALAVSRRRSRQQFS